MDDFKVFLTLNKIQGENGVNLVIVMSIKLEGQKRRQKFAKRFS